MRFSQFASVHISELTIIPPKCGEVYEIQVAYKNAFIAKTIVSVL